MDRARKAWESAREVTLEHSDHTCCRCGRSSDCLHVHHIKPRRMFDDPAEAHRPENLIALCPRCHPKVEQLTRRIYPPPLSDNVKVEVVNRMLRKRIVGGKNRTIDTVVNMALPSHDQGRGRQLIDEMLADPTGPTERYGGSRDAIRLTSVEKAVEYLKENDGNVPFNFD